MAQPADQASVRDGGNSGLAPVWHQLRAAREARGVSILEVAQHLKFTPKQIDAMEAGRIDRLPGIAFARGFIRNYARYLQIDPQPFLAALNETVPPREAQVPTRPTGLGHMPRAGSADRSSLRALAISVGLLAIAVAGWYFGWFEPRDEAALEAELALAASVPAQFEQADNPVLQDVPAPAAMVEQSLPVAEASAAAATATTQSAPAMASAPTAAAMASAAVAAPAQSAAMAGPGQKRLVFAFQSDSWVEVRDANDNVLFSRLSLAGTTQEVVGRAPLRLVIGNAPQVQLTFNGRSVDLQPHTRVTVARLTLE